MQIKLYQAIETPCGYFDDRTSQSVVVDPELEVNQQLTSWFSQEGYRRSGEMIYLPNCQGCQACISCRLKTDEFKPSKSQKRVINKFRRFAQSDENEISLEIVPAQYSTELYELFERYINLRHKDGDMYPASQEQFKSFLCQDFQFNFFLVIKNHQKPILVSLFDQLSDGLSAVYSFFDPDYEFLSPGVLAVLKLIELNQKMAQPYLYLGYWIKDCKKMNYKANYQPLEMYKNGQWEAYVSDTSLSE